MASCNARGELANVWDDATRAKIGHGWTAAGTEVSARNWDRARGALDRYANAWVGAADAACKSPSPIAAVGDFRQRCLRSAQVQIRVVAERFASNDPKVMTAGDRIVASLPAIDDCGNSAPRVWAPTDPFMRIAVDHMRDELAAADGQSIAGQFEVASTAIDKIAAEARTLGFKPLLAEVQYSRAMNLRGAAAKPEVTSAALRDAAAAAEASGDEVLAVRAWTALAFQAGEVSADPARGREYVGYAAAALERLGGNPGLEGRIETTRARIDWHEGKFADARREYAHALALAGTNLVPIIEASSGLALVDTSEGELAKALDEDLRVLELRRKQYGDDNLEMARSYSALGDVTMRMGRLNESLDYYRKADETVQRVFGPEHSMAGLSAHNFGGILRDLGRPADAERELRRAIRIDTQTMGPEHPYTAKSEQSLGMALSDEGKFAEAVTLLRHAVAVKTKAYGDNGLETIGAINDLGIALRGAGKLDESLQDLDKAIAGFAATEGPKSDDLAQAYVARGRTLIAAHREREARAALDKAKAIYAQTEAPAARLDEIRQLQQKIRAAR